MNDENSYKIPALNSINAQNLLKLTKEYSERDEIKIQITYSILNQLLKFGKRREYECNIYIEQHISEEIRSSSSIEYWMPIIIEHFKSLNFVISAICKDQFHISWSPKNMKGALSLV